MQVLAQSGLARLLRTSASAASGEKKRPKNHRGKVPDHETDTELGSWPANSEIQA